jgi:hypothetical protein
VPAMLVMLAVDRSTWLPPHRLVDSLLLGIVLAGGAGLGLACAAAIAWWRLPAGLTTVFVTAIVAASSLAGQTLTVWPRTADWPTLPDIERGLRLPALWAALRAAPPGRVLFVRSGVPLRYGSEWYRPHTHVTALTPLYAGRAIINGTFTHPSAIAALVYTGSPAPAAIRTLVERLDGHTLFGQPLGALDASTLDRFLDFLGVSTVVLLDEDAGRFPALESSARFVRRAVPPFIVYTGAAPRPSLPTAVSTREWRLTLPDERQPWVSAGVAFSSLWRAESSGRPLGTRRGHLGDLEVEARPPGTPVILAYGPAGWELAGILISAVGALAGAGLYFLSRAP